MADQRLPHINDFSTRTSNIILLTGIGSRLRSHYETLLHGPLPERLDALLRRLQ